MVQESSSSSITLSSLYSSGQCLLSVLGSIGVILLFAGIPQLIYAPKVNPGSLLTFLLGVLLISLMVAGNAFIGYKYRQLVRERREEIRHRSLQTRTSEDKPPSYDDLLKAEGLPPAYAAAIKEKPSKPPRYDDLVTEVFNWGAITRVQERFRRAEEVVQPPSQLPSPCEETPIIIPLQRNISEAGVQTTASEACLDNLAYESCDKFVSVSLQNPAISGENNSVDNINNSSQRLDTVNCEDECSEIQRTKLKSVVSSSNIPSVHKSKSDENFSDKVETRINIDDLVDIVQNKSSTNTKRNDSSVDLESNYEASSSNL